MSFWPSSSRLKLSETSWWFSTITTLVAWPLAETRVTGGRRRTFNWLMGGDSGQLGYLDSLVVVSEAEPLRERAQPPANLSQAVERGHANCQ